MNARAVLSLAMAMIAFSSLARSEEKGVLPAAVDDHFYQSNSSAQGLVPPALETDVRAVKSGSARGRLNPDSSRYTTFSAANSKARGSKRVASVKAGRSKAGIPPLWIGIMCVGAGFGLMIATPTVWRRYRISRCDWMANEGQGRVKFQRRVRSAAPLILASNLIRAQAAAKLVRSQQRATVKFHVAGAEEENHEETRELRRAA